MGMLGLVSRRNTYGSKLCPSLKDRRGPIVRNHIFDSFFIFLLFILIESIACSISLLLSQLCLTAPRIGYSKAITGFQGFFSFVFSRITIHVVLVLGNLYYVIFSEHEPLLAGVAS